jgi:hypothetical protein
MSHRAGPPRSGDVSKANAGGFRHGSQGVVKTVMEEAV